MEEKEERMPGRHTQRPEYGKKGTPVQKAADRERSGDQPVSVLQTFVENQRNRSSLQSLLHYTCKQNMHKKDNLLLNDYYSTYAPQGNVYNGEEGNIPFYEGQSLSSFERIVTL